MSQKSMLKHFLETTFCVDGVNDYESVKRTLKHPNFPDREREFKEELSNAINLGTYTIDEFERLTGIDFESQDEIQEFLTDEIWKPLYGNEPIQA